MDNKQSRWTSKAAWAALFGLIGLCLGAFGGYEALGITEGTWQTLTTALLSVLVGFGVLNNPTDANGF